MTRSPHMSLIRVLVSAVASGGAAGLAGGIVFANSLPLLQSLLADDQIMARIAFLIVCGQVGAVIALAFAMVPERDPTS